MEKGLKHLLDGNGDLYHEETYQEFFKQKKNEKIFFEYLYGQLEEDELVKHLAV